MASFSAERLPRSLLEQGQLQRLRALLAEGLTANRFQIRRLHGIRAEDIQSLDDVRRLPLLTKADLLADQAEHPPYGSNLTYPLAHYCRLFQTSGTSGRPLRWLDTQDSMRWMHGCWDQIFDIVNVGSSDRLFFPFSFGPFLGFWTAFEAAARRGWWCLPGGGMSTGARLRFLLEHSATIILCTPTYALHLLEAAQNEGIDLPASPVRALIVAGEPGGSIAATRARIEQGFGARVFDHSGMTESGPLTIECPENPGGLHLLESECLAEVIDPQTLAPVPVGQRGELVLTNFGRTGSPLIRYRTGDLVCLDAAPCPCGRTFARLGGGILGRVDDMVHVRGNNLHPSALEAVVRRFAEVAEFRVEIDHTGPLTAVRLEVEPAPAAVGIELAGRVEQAIRDELLFRADVRAVAPGALPRYEMKAQRVKHIR